MKTVRYLMSGPAHIPYLITSLYALRNFAKHDGQIYVYAYPESYVVLKDLPNTFDVELILYKPIPTPKNNQFINKIRMMKSMRPGESALYLDADTMPMQSIDPLFYMAESCPMNFLPTQFNDWTSNSRAPAGRIRRLLDRDPIPQSMVHKCLDFPHPSPNGGIFAVHQSRESEQVLNAWYDWTMAVIDIFIADETVLHVLIPWFKLNCTVGWNWSPKYIKEGDRKDVKIWHYHGDSNVRSNKSQFGVDTWLPVFRKCCNESAMNLDDIWDSCGNKYLNRLMEKKLIEKGSDDCVPFPQEI